MNNDEMNWVIAGEKKDAAPIIGAAYEIRHSRKGTFVGRILAVRGNWADVEVLEGEIRQMSTEAKMFNPNPETVTIRDILSYLTIIGEPDRDGTQVASLAGAGTLPRRQGNGMPRALPEED